MYESLKVLSHLVQDKIDIKSLKVLSHLVQDKIDIKSIYSVYGNIHILDFISKEHQPYSMSITCTADRLTLNYHFKNELNRVYDYVDLESHELFNEAADCIVDYFNEVLPNTAKSYQVAIDNNKDKINELETKNKELVNAILNEYQKILDKSTTDLNSIKDSLGSIVNANGGSKVKIKDTDKNPKSFQENTTPQK